jgi:hypothetical protein
MTNRDTGLHPNSARKHSRAVWYYNEAGLPCLRHSVILRTSKYAPNQIHAAAFCVLYTVADITFYALLSGSHAHLAVVHRLKRHWSNINARRQVSKFGSLVPHTIKTQPPFHSIIPDQNWVDLQECQTQGSSWRSQNVLCVKLSDEGMPLYDGLIVTHALIMA